MSRGFSFALVAVLPMVICSEPQAAATLFVGARLIADADRPPIEDAAWIVENERIVKVGRRSEVQAPVGAARIDLTGKTVMPVIVNAHGHVGFLRDTSFSAANYTRDNIVNQLKQYA